MMLLRPRHHSSPPRPPPLPRPHKTISIAAKKIAAKASSEEQQKQSPPMNSSPPNSHIPHHAYSLPPPPHRSPIVPHRMAAPEGAWHPADGPMRGGTLPPPPAEWAQQPPPPGHHQHPHHQHHPDHPWPPQQPPPRLQTYSTSPPGRHGHTKSHSRDFLPPPLPPTLGGSASAGAATAPRRAVDRASPSLRFEHPQHRARSAAASRHGSPPPQHLHDGPMTNGNGVGPGGPPEWGHHPPPQIHKRKRSDGYEPYPPPPMEQPGWGPPYPPPPGYGPDGWAGPPPGMYDQEAERRRECIYEAEMGPPVTKKAVAHHAPPQPPTQKHKKSGSVESSRSRKPSRPPQSPRNSHAAHTNHGLDPRESPYHQGQMLRGPPPPQELDGPYPRSEAGFGPPMHPHYAEEGPRHVPPPHQDPRFGAPEPSRQPQQRREMTAEAEAEKQRHERQHAREFGPRGPGSSAGAAYDAGVPPGQHMAGYPHPYQPEYPMPPPPPAAAAAAAAAYQAPPPPPAHHSQPHRQPAHHPPAVELQHERRTRSPPVRQDPYIEQQQQQQQQQQQAALAPSLHHAPAALGQQHPAAMQQYPGPPAQRYRIINEGVWQWLDEFQIQQTGSINPRPAPFAGTWLYEPFKQPLLPLDVLASNVASLVEVRISGKALGLYREKSDTHAATGWSLGWRARQAGIPIDCREGGGRPLEPEAIVHTLKQRRTNGLGNDFWAQPSLAGRKVWGSEVYTDDSDVLAMCVHSGWIEGPAKVDQGEDSSNGHGSGSVDIVSLAETTGLSDLALWSPPDLRVTLRVAPRLVGYRESYGGGLWSRNWLGMHNGVSLLVEKVELEPAGFASPSTLPGLRGIKRGTSEFTLARRKVQVLSQLDAAAQTRPSSSPPKALSDTAVASAPRVAILDSRARSVFPLSEVRRPGAADAGDDDEGDKDDQELPEKEAEGAQAAAETARTGSADKGTAATSQGKGPAASASTARAAPSTWYHLDEVVRRHFGAGATLASKKGSLGGGRSVVVPLRA